MTAEKFIDNPFGKGKLYKTGDLAYWREDGNIVYVGRNDFQVKIRGLRIELGEIESVMSTFDGIQLAAVTDKRDENGKQYLAGYYTADNEIDEKALRAYLAAKLPKYMIPNYFMRLDEMPMTSSGKTDRKNLPVPGFSAAQTEFVSLETQTEMEQIGLSDNIPQDIQTVIHTAASVKHYGSYEYFRNVNVLGTENVIAYTKMCGARLIHISTVSVSGNSLADEIEVYRSAREKNFDETLLYIGQPLENVYIHSKFEAEVL